MAKKQKAAAGGGGGGGGEGEGVETKGRDKTDSRLIASMVDKKKKKQNKKKIFNRTSASVSSGAAAVAVAVAAVSNGGAATAATNGTISTNEKGNYRKKLSLSDVIALGGDENDMTLVAGIESDDYSDDGDGDGCVIETSVLNDNDAAAGKSMLKDIGNFVKQLGLPNSIPIVAEDDEHDDVNTTSDAADVSVISSVTLHAGKGKFDELSKDSDLLKIAHEAAAAKHCDEKKAAYSASEGRHAGVKGLRIDMGVRWYEQTSSASVAASAMADETIVTTCRTRATKLLEAEIRAYDGWRSENKDGDFKWVKTMLVGGTLTDKMAAMTLLVQESPVHNMKILEDLLALAAKHGRRESSMAIDTLKDLWLANLLPDRKLIEFSRRPLLIAENINSRRHSGAAASAGVSDATLVLWLAEDKFKIMYGEFVRILEKKSYDIIEQIKERAVSSAAQLLSQKPEQEKGLLALLVNKLGDPERKIASKVTYHLQRLLVEHSAMKLVVVKEVERLLYRPNVSSRAQYYGVIFLNQITLSRTDPDLATRLIVIYFSFFKTFSAKDKEVDSRMLSALLTGVNRAFPFAPINDDLYDKQVDALFRVSHVATFNTSVQALMLLFQVLQARQSVSDRFYSALYSKLLSIELMSSGRHAMFLNLLYKAMKADTNVPRVRAILKRLMQVCTMQQPAFTCGALVVVSEIMSERIALADLVLAAPDLDDDIEHFVDCDNDDDTTASSNINGGSETNESKECSRASEYDMLKRDPRFAKADEVCAWELHLLRRHFHSSVEKFVEELLSGHRVSYQGDCLQDFTTIKFLDRFSYRNPKKTEAKHGVAIMHRASKESNIEPVNSLSFYSMAPEDVPPEELFFHKYFKAKGRRNTKKDNDSDIGDADCSFDNDDSWMDDIPGMNADDEDIDIDDADDDDFDMNSSENEDAGDDEVEWSSANDDEEMPPEESVIDDDDDNGESDDEDIPMPKKRKTVKRIGGTQRSEDLIASAGAERHVGTSGAVFASAEDFAHILESSGNSLAHPKQIAWEERHSRGGKRKRGSGGRGRGGKRR